MRRRSLWYVLTAVLALVICPIIAQVLAGYLQDFLKDKKASSAALEFWQSHWQLLCISIAGIAVLCFPCLLLAHILGRNAQFRNTWRVWREAKNVTPSCFRIQGYKELCLWRESTDKIRDCLGRRKSVLITGRPKAGKTRAAYEAIKQMRHFSVLIMEPRDIAIEKIKAPLLRKRSFVLFLDDLQYFTQVDIEGVCEALRSQSERFLMVATCRSRDELNTFKENKLAFYREFEVVELEDISAEDAKRFAADADLPWRPERFDGTPGSVTLDLEDVRLKYRNAGDKKPVLKALKLLNRAHSYIYDRTCVRDVCQHVFEIPREQLSKHSWDEMLVYLRDSHLIMLSGDEIDIYQPYLDICVDDYDPPPSDFNRLRQMWVSLNDPRGLLRLGLSFCSADRWEDACNCYRDAIQIQPSYWPTRTYLGYAMTRWGEAEEQRGRKDKAAGLYQSACKEHREALRIDDLNRTFAASQRYVLHRNLAYVLAKLGQVVEAESEYKEALELNPDDPTAQTCLAYLLARLHRYDEAETQLRRTIAAFPEYAIAYVNLAYVSSSGGRYAEAAKVAETAIKMKSDCAEAYNALGYALQNLGQYVQAESRYRQCLDLNPNYVEARNNLAYLCEKQKRHEEAAQEYSKSLETCVTDADALLGLAISLEHLGKDHEAEKKYVQAVKQDPHSAKARMSYASFLKARGRPAEAAAQYKAITVANPKDVRPVDAPAAPSEVARSHANRAKALADNGKLSEAANECNHAIAADGMSALAHKTLGIVHEKRGDQTKDAEKRRVCYEEAEREYRIAGRLSKHSPSIVRHLANILAKLGRDQEAESAYRKVKDLADRYPNNNRDFGLFLFRRGRKEEARAELEHAVRLFDTQGNTNEANGLRDVLRRLRDEGDQAKH